MTHVRLIFDKESILDSYFVDKMLENAVVLDDVFNSRYFKLKIAFFFRGAEKFGLRNYVHMELLL